MLALTCERAELNNDIDILELGCGWGSLTLWMAEHYPNARITAVSNSAPQRHMAPEVRRHGATAPDLRRHGATVRRHGAKGFGATAPEPNWASSAPFGARAELSSALEPNYTV